MMPGLDIVLRALTRLPAAIAQLINGLIKATVTVVETRVARIVVIAVIASLLGFYGLSQPAIEWYAAGTDNAILKAWVRVILGAMGIGLPTIGVGYLWSQRS